MNDRRSAARFCAFLTLVAFLSMAAPAAATITASGTSTAQLVNTGAAKMTIGTSYITCDSATMSTTVSGSSMSAAAAGTTLDDCKYTWVGISGTATIADTTNTTFTVTGSLGGGSFSFSWTNGHTVATGGPCTVTFQTNTYSGLTWTNTTKSMVFFVTGVGYTASGFFCPLPAVGTNGTIALSMSAPKLTVV